MNHKTIGVCSVTENIIPFYMCKKCMNRKLWEGKQITLLTKEGIKKPEKQPCLFVPLIEFPIEERQKLIFKFKEKIKVMQYAKRNSTDN